VFDLIADLIGILFDAGELPSPETLKRQRQARLAVSVAALVVNLSLPLVLGASALGGWSIWVLVATCGAAGWVLVVSVIDAAKELPSVAWLSITAASVAASAIAVTLLFAFAGRLGAG